MYISKITTDYRKRGDVYELHQLLWKGFADGDNARERDFLFRAERLPRKQAVILVQSVSRPCWDGVFPPSGVAVKSYAPVFKNGQVFHFLIQVSASVAKSNGPGRQPTKKPLPWEAYTPWFRKRGKTDGFEVMAAEKVNDVFVSSRKKPKLRFAGRILTGMLRISESDAFLHAYQQGIGRGRAFGFGMLSLMGS
ncbi:type I-E CRISPR-associated protein Cas6/Cse3/Cas E [Desulfonema ishimotonii]|uniref:Type I-E CRISPR-associated protein Cas6/Cse3/Cas E n=1 Tax=Desulfonema ishimotonii TaxID=45657 RepID=A0A401FWV3_9BACT|nr:type I-E CRISPR-associated protein Cas6/Cse3/CasE [Desulfonema ishimotonii]GBC61450.1 type I-E CRISPR-associated protein Cas6/Cse3/Cas E [Desulfonema ishimotonii]